MEFWCSSRDRRSMVQCESGRVSLRCLLLLLVFRAASKALLGSLREQVARIRERDQAQPKLAVILVGNRRDSISYVSMKTTVGFLSCASTAAFVGPSLSNPFTLFLPGWLEQQCKMLGIQSQQINLDESISQEELSTVIKSLDHDPSVNGILVQLPLPDHLSRTLTINAIRPVKDVDGLCRYNRADIIRAYHRPCTPLGILELLQRHQVKIAGSHAVVLGRSNLVGKPVSDLLLSLDATVTTCHTHTANLAQIISQAEILISAIGVPHFVKAEWIKPGAVVIDVGINAVEDSKAKKGYTLVGDVDFNTAKEVASKITPVPGGCGPMTVAMLMQNTINAYEIQNNLKREHSEKIQLGKSVDWSVRDSTGGQNDPSFGESQL